MPYAWYTPQMLIFLLPLGLGLFLSVISAIMGDVSHGGGHNASHGAMHHGGASHHATHHAQRTVAQQESMLAKACYFLGIGRVPITIYLTCFFVVWGITGILVLQFLLLVLPALLILPGAVIVSWLVATILSKYISMFIARFIARSESYGISSQSFLGQIATTRFPGVTPKFGSAQLYDAHHECREIQCRIKDGEEEIQGGVQVMLVDFSDPDCTVYYVKSFELPRQGE